MCNRESFILYPEVTGIPVAWGMSYHHDAITGAARLVNLFCAKATEEQHYIQIECKDGDVKRWDWDNTQMKQVKKFKAVERDFFMIWDGDKPTQTHAEIEEVEIPDLPGWLEDNLHFYENRVERILEQLNPWRNRADNLCHYLTNPRSMISGLANSSFDLPELIQGCTPDSPEVEEFEAIINGYRQISGFVYDENFSRENSFHLKLQAQIYQNIRADLDKMIEQYFIRSAVIQDTTQVGSSFKTIMGIDFSGPTS